MTHEVDICVERNGNKSRVLKARETTIREKFLAALFGRKAKVLVVTPTSAVNTITISEK